MSNFEVKVSQWYCNSFGLYLAYQNYRTDDSNNSAERNISPAGCDKCWQNEDMNSNVTAVRTVCPVASTEIISSPVHYWPWVHGVHTYCKAFYIVLFINKSLKTKYRFGLQLFEIQSVFLCFSDDLRKLLVHWTLSLRKVVQSSALYCAVKTVDLRKLLVR